MRQPVDVTLTVADGIVRLTGPEVDVSGEHQGVRPGLKAAVEELRAARVRSNVAQRGTAAATLKDIAVDHAAGLLAESFLPPEVGRALGELIRAARVADVPVRLGVQATGGLARLPWEALRDPDSGRPLALHPLVNVYRKVSALPPRPVPGPLKILIAISSPDGSHAARLDYQRELRSVLEAVRTARHADAQVRIVPFASTEAIRAELLRQPVHVLHVSGHGSPGLLHLEDSQGKARAVTADQFVDEAIPPGRMPAVIALAACHTDVTGNGDDVSLAEALCGRGASVVIATQTSITDRYSTWVFARMYAELVATQVPDVVTAVAEARRRVQADLAGSRNPIDREIAGLGEWATVTVLASQGSVAIFDPTAPRSAELSPDTAQQLTIAGLLHRPVGGFVGRRMEQRRWPAQLAGTGRSGMVLHGIGGIGKTTLAAELVDRLQAGPDRWVIASVTGQVTMDEVLAKVSMAVRQHLIASGQAAGVPWQVAQALSQVDASWQDRFNLLREYLLDRVPLLLVLDNFEDNLTAGTADGWEVADTNLAGLLSSWARQPGRSRMLLTCRYPFTLPAHAHRVLLSHQLRPLTFPETLHLMFALPALDVLELDQLERVWQLLGGHPRSLEYLDAILSGGHGRYPDITTRLAAKLTTTLNPEQQGQLVVDESTLDVSLAQVATIAADEVLLDELIVGLRRTPGAVPLLLGASVYREPVDWQALLFQVGHPDEDAAYVPDRRAANASMRAVLERAGISITDNKLDLESLPRPVMEAIAPHLAELIRPPVPPRRAPNSFDAMVQAGVVSSLLTSDEASGRIFVHRWTATELHRRWNTTSHADEITAAHQRAADYWQWRVRVWPQDPRADVHDLLEARHHLLCADDLEQADAVTERAVSQLTAWGAWDQAHSLTQDMLTRLPDGHPRHATHLHQLGILAQSRGDYTEAEHRYQQSLTIDEKLGNRASMASSYHNLGSLAQDRGDYTEANRRYQQSLTINEELGNRVGMSSSYHHLGMLAQDRGDYAEANRRYQQSLTINEKLGNRASMASSYHQMGTLAHNRGDYAEAERRYQQALTIEEELGNRAGMAGSYHQMGVLAQERGDYPEAEHRYQQSLTILKEVGDRAGMAGTYHNLGILAQNRGDYPEAERRYQQSLTIEEELGNRAGMATSYSQIGNLAEERQRISEATAWHLRAFLIRAQIGVPQARNNVQRLLKYRDALGPDAFGRITNETVGDPGLANQIIEWLDQVTLPDE